MTILTSNIKWAPNFSRLPYYKSSINILSHCTRGWLHTFFSLNLWYTICHSHLTDNSASYYTGKTNTIWWELYLLSTKSTRLPALATTGSAFLLYHGRPNPQLIHWVPCLLMSSWTSCNYFFSLPCQQFLPFYYWITHMAY